MPDASWELDWTTRPREEAALFNPAFCGEIIVRSAASYLQVKPQGFALPLAYLLLPLTLSAQLRDALPRRSDTTFVTWSGLNRVLLADLPDRVSRCGRSRARRCYSSSSTTRSSSRRLALC